MIVGKENILQWFQLLPEDCVYWKLYQAGQKQSGYSFTESSMIDGVSKHDQLEDLRQKLNLLAYGKYTISAQAKPGTLVKGSFFTDFEVPLNGTNTNTQQQQGFVAGLPNGFVSAAEAEKKADERFERKMLEWELKQANEKIEKLEKELKQQDKPSFLEQIAGMAMPMLAAKFGGAQTPVVPMQQPLAQVGTLDAETVIETEAGEEELQRLQTVLNKVEQTFGEPSLPFLEKLMAYIEANPHFVGMIKGVIK